MPYDLFVAEPGLKVRSYGYFRLPSHRNIMQHIKPTAALCTVRVHGYGKGLIITNRTSLKA